MGPGYAGCSILTEMDAAGKSQASPSRPTEHEARSIWRANAAKTAAITSISDGRTHR
jgi:hypothetical protein